MEKLETTINHVDFADRLKAWIGFYVLVNAIMSFDLLEAKLTHWLMLLGWGDWSFVPGVLLYLGLWIGVFTTYSIARKSSVKLKWWQIGPAVGFLCFLAMIFGLSILVFSGWPTD